MEAVRPRGRGRPKKCPRRELPEAEGTIANKIHAAEEMTETSAENYGSDGNSPPILVSEDSPENNDTVAVEAAPATSAPAPEDHPAVPAAAEANDRLPSAIVIKPRRRPRKGIPVRSPFF